MSKACSNMAVYLLVCTISVVQSSKDIRTSNSLHSGTTFLSLREEILNRSRLKGTENVNWLYSFNV